jgi:ABC-type transport system substrate-binding protein
VFLSRSLPVASAASQGGGTLVCARGHQSLGLNPGSDSNGESWKVIAHLYDGLVAFRPGTFDVVPALALGWEVLEGGAVYVFDLRRDVRFHDGTHFDADAVLFSHLRQHDDRHPCHGPAGTWPCWLSAGMNQVVEAIEKVDAFSVKYRLRGPTATFLPNLAMPCFAVVSPAAAREFGAQFGRRPVGTGPFRFVQWADSGDIVLEANNDFWGEKPRLGRLVYRCLPTAAERARQLLAGAVYVAESPDTAALGEHGQAREARFRVIRKGGMNVGFIAMNCEKRPFDDPRVRRAINYAIDRSEVIARVYRGYAQLAGSPIPPDLGDYHDAGGSIPYDPPRATALLADAGFPNGFGTDLWVLPAARPYLPDAPALAEIVRDRLERVKVRVTVRRVSTEEEYWRNVDEGEHMMCMDGWTSDNGDPDNFLTMPLCANSTVNVARWRNREFTDLVEQARHTLAPASRRAIYHRAQEVFREELPWVPLAHADVCLLARNEVAEMAVGPTGCVSFREARIAAGQAPD